MTEPSRFPAPVRPFQWTELEKPPPTPAARPSDPRSEPPLGPDPEAILAQARREADALLDVARAEAEALREEARRQGYRDGLEEGQSLAQEAAVRWERLAEELAGYRPKLYEDARSQVVELVLALVEKVLGPLAEGDREAVVRVAGQALLALSDREILTLRVNPEDLQGLLEAKPRLLQTFDGIKKLTVLEDPSVGRGGCLVETPTAEIDARLESQLQEIARALRKV